MYSRKEKHFLSLNSPYEVDGFFCPILSLPEIFFFPFFFFCFLVCTCKSTKSFVGSSLNSSLSAHICYKFCLASSLLEGKGRVSSSQGMLLSTEKCVWMVERFFMDGLWLLAAEVAGSSCHNYYAIKKKSL